MTVAMLGLKDALGYTTVVAALAGASLGERSKCIISSGLRASD